MLAGWGNVRLAPPAGDAGWEPPNAKGEPAAGAGFPNENGVVWLNVDGLLGAEPGPKPNVPLFAGAPNENAGAGAVVDVGVTPKENAPAVAGLADSSAGLMGCPNENEVVIGAGAAALPNEKGLELVDCESFAPNALLVTLAEMPKENGAEVGSGEAVAALSPKMPPLVLVVLDALVENANPLPIMGLLLFC